MKEKRKFAVDVVLSFASSALNLLLGFVITVFLGKHLGAQGLGAYKLVATVLGICLLFAAVGIPSTVTKFVAEHKTNRRELSRYISAGIVFSLISGILGSLVIIFLSKRLAIIYELPKLEEYLYILSPVFPIALLGQVFLGALNGLREMKRYAIGIVVQAIAMVTVTVTLIMLSFGVLGAILGIAISSTISCLFLFAITKKYFVFTLSYLGKTLGTSLNFGSKLFMASVVNETNTRLDILLIGVFLTPKDIGYYSAALGLSRFLWIIPLSIQKISFPITSSYWKDNNLLELNKILNISIKLSTILLVSLGVLVVFFSNDLVRIIFNESFHPAVLPLCVLLVGSVVRGSIAQPIGGSFAAIGRPDISLKISGFMLSINLVLNLVLIPKYGILGAASATSISLITGSIISLILNTKMLSFKFDTGYSVRIFVSAIFAVLLYFFLKQHYDSFVFGMLYYLIYLVITLKLLVKKDDKKELLSLVTSLLSKGE